MPDPSLYEVLKEERGDLTPELDQDVLDRILTEPEQNTLAEAILADSVEAAPLVGDLLHIQKMKLAEERGIDYPENATRVEDTLGDLPTPLDSIGELLVANHVPHYLNTEYGIEPRTPVQDTVTEASEQLREALDARLE